jgi:hypothetical protein
MRHRSLHLSRFLLGVGLSCVLFVGILADPTYGDGVDIHFLAPTGPVTGTTTVVIETEASSVLLDYSLDQRASWIELIAVFEDPLWQAEWDTGTFTGKAVLRARADGSSAEVEVRVDNTSPSVEVTVSKTPFSPNGDGRKDRTSIAVGASEAGILKLEIVDADGIQRRAWRRREVTPGITDLSWGGRGDGKFCQTADTRSGRV